jgi:fimbrial isopeptide formation D2 family protein
MQNITNQTPAYYTKPGIPAPAPTMSNQTPSTPVNNKKPKTKQILAIVGVVFFLIVAVMGVLIAQRQLTRPGEDVTPVAPTAPESTPSAVSYEPNNCVTLFYVPELIAKVECVEKTMLDLQGRLIANGGALIRGQQYEYRVTAKVTNTSDGEVKVHDIIPAGLKYVRPATGSEKYITNDPSSGLLIANFGILQNDEATVGFIVEVPEDMEPTEFTNTAFVYDIPADSRQAEPPSDADQCSISHKILPIGVAECVEKEAFTDFNGTAILAGSSITPGDEFIYQITVTASQATTEKVTIIDKLPTDLTFIQDSGNTQGVTYNATTREVSIDLGTIQSGETRVVEFKVQLSSAPQNDSFKNIATVSTGNEDDICEISLNVKQSFACNSACETNADCTSANANYVCYSTESGKFCRLDSNPTSTTCTAGTPTPTPPASPTPTPAPGCNDVCIQNADCSNTDHICVTVDDGSNRCRLAEYPESTTCTAPSVSQPVLPTELPQSGPEDWLKWLKAGLVTLGIGTALFLLL